MTTLKHIPRFWPKPFVDMTEPGALTRWHLKVLADREEYWRKNPKKGKAP
jgi:hypothetical protein